MSVNAQLLRLKKQLEDAERKQKECEKVLLYLVTRTKSGHFDKEKCHRSTS